MPQTLFRPFFPPYRLLPGLTALVPEFLAHTQAALETFAAALAAADYVQISRFGHNLRGSGASFGFPYLSELGQAIEAAAQAQDLQTLQYLFHASVAYLNWVKATLPNALAPHGQAPVRAPENLEQALKQHTRGRSQLGQAYRKHQLAQLGRYVQGVIKRSLDILGSLGLLLLLAPLLLGVALAIWLEDRGPVLFSQQRVGKGGQPFAFYKFRSMVPHAEALKAELQHLNESGGGVIFKSRQDPRITRVGRWIRRFSIDELPQLYHVLKGEMSLVGPRPPVPAEVALYTPAQRKRLDVTPGLTCIWQVSGRSEIPFQQQVQLDQTYIQRQSLRLDLLLLLRTVKAVLGGRGAY